MIVHEPCRAWSRGDMRTHGWSSAAGRHTALTPQAFPTHCCELPDNRTCPEEFGVYETTAIVQLTLEEDDHIFDKRRRVVQRFVVIRVVDARTVMISTLIVLATFTAEICLGFIPSPGGRSDG